MFVSLRAILELFGKKALFATLDCTFSAILVTSLTCSASWTDNALSSIGRCDKKISPFRSTLDTSYVRLGHV